MACESKQVSDLRVITILILQAFEIVKDISISASTFSHCAILRKDLGLLLSCLLLWLLCGKML